MDFNDDSASKVIRLLRAYFRCFRDLFIFFRDVRLNRLSLVFGNFLMFFIKET
jgi:hypothetical protein